MIWLAKLSFFIACFMLGWAISDQRGNKIPFGRNFLSFKTQIAVMIWLMITQLEVLVLLGM